MGQFCHQHKFPYAHHSCMCYNAEVAPHVVSSALISDSNPLFWCCSAINGRHVPKFGVQSQPCMACDKDYLLGAECWSPSWWRPRARRTRSRRARKLRRLPARSLTWSRYDSCREQCSSALSASQIHTHTTQNVLQDRDLALAR